jgi:hypothetical protein
VNDKVKTKTGLPESFGWQRAPDYDTQTTICYEHPDGMLKAFPRNKKPMIVRLIDAENPRRCGERDQEKGPLDLERVRNSYERLAEKWRFKKGP